MWTSSDFDDQRVVLLALTLFKELPKRKKLRVYKWYLKNNWDVYGHWGECVKIATKMVEDWVYITSSQYYDWI